MMRIRDPLKQWKLSPMDMESRRLWEQYTKAKETMLERTHIPEAQWWIVEAVDKKKARLNCIHLRRFCRTHHGAIDRGLLNVHLWCHERHSFHVKGLMADDDYTLLTGHNINPRAWRLDLENGLLIHDPQRKLLRRNQAELKTIRAHTRRLNRYTSPETIDSYPASVQRPLKRLGRTRIDRLLNQVL